MMNLSLADVRKHVKQQILIATRSNPAIRGCIDYGSTSEGRDDALSDLDLALFIRDEDLQAFTDDWKRWAAGFGTLLLAYVGGVGHPWAVYDAEPLYSRHR